MLKHTKAFSSFSVDDLARARDFYARTVGLGVVDGPEGLQLRLSGGPGVFIYPTQRHKPAGYTVLNLVVDDIDAALDELGRLGIRMEHYDWPALKTDERRLFRRQRGSKAIARFQDPAGNVLSVIQER